MTVESAMAMALAAERPPAAGSRLPRASGKSGKSGRSAVAAATASAEGFAWKRNAQGKGHGHGHGSGALYGGAGMHTRVDLGGSVGAVGVVDAAALLDQAMARTAGLVLGTLGFLMGLAGLFFGLSAARSSVPRIHQRHVELRNSKGTVRTATADDRL